MACSDYKQKRYQKKPGMEPRSETTVHIHIHGHKSYSSALLSGDSALTSSIFLNPTECAQVVEPPMLFQTMRNFHIIDGNCISQALHSEYSILGLTLLTQ